MRRTARVTDALCGRKEAVAYVGTADALLSAGTASAATAASTAHAAAPAQATTAQATTIPATATLGAAAQRVVKDAVADVNQRNGAPDQKLAVHMPAARRSDMDRGPGLKRTGPLRAQPARTGLANISRQRARPRPELLRHRP